MENEKALPRGLFYNTSPLGLGHLQRSLYLSKWLLSSFKIDYLLGSLPLLPIPKSPNFTLLELPPLTMPRDGAPLQDPRNEKSEQEIRLLRKEYIKKNITKKYDFFICEHFPFGRIGLQSEILFLIHTIKSKNPSCLITCSFRGEKKIPQGLIQNTEALLQNVFDFIFVHIDPEATPPFDLLDLFLKFRKKIYFTGVVVDPLEAKGEGKNSNQIIVSMGTGTYGDEFIRLLLKTAPLLKDYDFHFVIGPKIQDSLKTEIEERAKKEKNVILSPFNSGFIDKLKESALSISFGGAGTISDVLQTRVKALVYPHPSQDDQIERVRKLKAKGLVSEVLANDLSEERLKSLILEALNKPSSNSSIQLTGGLNTLKKLQELLSLSSR